MVVGLSNLGKKPCQLLRLKYHSPCAVSILETTYSMGVRNMPPTGRTGDGKPNHLKRRIRTHVTKAQTLATNIGEADDIHFYASGWIFYFGLWTMCAQCFTDTSLSVDWGLGRKLHETSSRRKSRNQSTFAALQLQTLVQILKKLL